MNRLRLLQVSLSEAVGGTTVEHLERRGHDVAVETVTDAAAALDGLGAWRPDCLVFGAALPEMDAPTFLERVRTEQPDLPAILVTDQGSTDRLEEALTAGVTECVCETDETARGILLAKRIHDAVERVRIERERDEERRFVDQLFDQVPVSLYVKDEQARHVRLIRKVVVAYR